MQRGCRGDAMSKTKSEQVPLSMQEMRIVMLAASGLCDKEIAARCCIAVPTVRTYWDRIRQKLSATNKTHAVYLACCRDALAINAEFHKSDENKSAVNR